MLLLLKQNMYKNAVQAHERRRMFGTVSLHTDDAPRKAPPRFRLILLRSEDVTHAYHSDRLYPFMQPRDVFFLALSLVETPMRQRVQ